MKSGARIAVIGAGLGGTVAAVLMQRAGFDVRVYEQANGLERIGAGINLDPHAMRIMRHIGVEQRLLQIGLPSATRSAREWDTGRVTYDVPVATYPEQYGACHFSIHRGDLQKVLVSAVAPGTLELGKRLSWIGESGDAVKISFADGSSTEADLVIGADGINSRIREVLLAPERPRYMGKVAYRAVFPTALLGGLELDDHVKWWGEERVVVAYKLTRARDEFYVMASLPEPEWGADDYTPGQADLAHVRRSFADFHSDVRRILDASPSMTRFAVLEREPLPFWSRGRIAMLGDACHPMAHHMAQGAAMAYEDAVILTRCLQQCGANDYMTAFRMYEAIRYERASRIQKASRHQWLQTPTDPGWVFNYDPFNAPLGGTASTHFNKVA
jgi:6-hydroxynicotinate 3-monooxygenase